MEAIGRQRVEAIKTREEIGAMLMFPIGLVASPVSMRPFRREPMLMRKPYELRR